MNMPSILISTGRVTHALFDPVPKVWIEIVVQGVPFEQFRPLLENVALPLTLGGAKFGNVGEGK